METPDFESLLPRLARVQSEVAAIRNDLRNAVEQERSAEQPEPAAEPEVVSLAREPETPPRPRLIEPEIPKPPKIAIDLETVLAGRWLNGAGLLLVFLGVAFFLKVAFDHDWIVPVDRVALGLLVGAAAIVYAQRIAAKGHGYFAEGITALGAAIEFLSLYSSTAIFHLASPLTALGGMVAVDAVVASIAWRRKSERLGILAAAAGFLAPMLCGTQAADPWMLGGYVAALAAGLLFLSELLDSKIVPSIALGGSLFYAFGVFAPAAGLNGVQRAEIYTLLYMVFASTGWIAAKVRAELGSTRSIIGAVAMGGVLLGLYTSLYDHHRALLAIVLLTLAALHLAAAVLCKSRYHSWLAAAALTVAIPAAFNHAAAYVAWAAESAVLCIAGLRFRDDVLRIAGLGLLGADVLIDLVVYSSYNAAHPILNERFAVGAAAVVAAYVMAFAINRQAVSEVDAMIVRVLRVTAHVVSLLVLSAEAWNGVAHYGGSVQASSAALSIVLAIFATVLVACGLYKRDAMLRWEGLGLIMLTAAKVLLIDLAYLELLYRVASAVLVGVALIGVSYAYQRRTPQGEQQS